MKGYKYLKGKRYPKAIEELERAQELSRDVCIVCLEGIAMAYYRAKNYQQAALAYEELLAAQPAVLPVLQRLVRLYDRVGTPEKSIAAYETFLESSQEPGDMITIYNELGVRRLTPNSGLEFHRNESAAAFRAALDLADGRSNLLRRNLAEALWQLGARQQALWVLDNLAADDEVSWSSLPALERTPELLAKEREVRSTWKPPARPIAGFVENVSCSQSRYSSGPDPLHVGGDVRKPVKISASQPQYTEAARKRREQGVVIVQAVIDEWGCVRATRVLEGISGDLDEQAVIAIWQWRFRPATLNGEPVAVYYNLTVNFRIQ